MNPLPKPPLVERFGSIETLAQESADGVRLRAAATDDALCIANEIIPYGETMGFAVAIQYNPDNSRPTFHFPADVVHALALEQRSGITDK